MRVDDLAHVPIAFPTYTGNLAYAAAAAACQLELDVRWHASLGTCLSTLAVCTEKSAAVVDFIRLSGSTSRHGATARAPAIA
jgi:hypothetical protein